MFGASMKDWIVLDESSSINGFWRERTNGMFSETSVRHQLRACNPKGRTHAWHICWQWYWACSSWADPCRRPRRSQDTRLRWCQSVDVVQIQGSWETSSIKGMIVPFQFQSVSFFKIRSSPRLLIQNTIIPSFIDSKHDHPPVYWFKTRLSPRLLMTDMNWWKGNVELIWKLKE